MKNCIIIIMAMAIAGCSSSKPEIKWVSAKNKDEFTDVSSCKVTVGSLYTHKNVYTEAGKFYPYIEKVDGVLRVGLQSGGKYKIPVGNIQLRIDSNKTWDISTSETPLDLAPPIQSFNTDYIAELSEEQKKIIEGAYESTLATSAKLISPYTVTTGDKAVLIVKEMLVGNELKYRTIGFNQAASSTGSYALDLSLKNSLIDCGIEL